MVATVQVASAPKSTNYRRNDMAEKSFITNKNDSERTTKIREYDLLMISTK